MRLSALFKGTWWISSRAILCGLIKSLSPASFCVFISLEQNPAEAHARYQLAAVQLIAERPKDTIDTLDTVARVQSTGIEDSAVGFFGV